MNKLSYYMEMAGRVSFKILPKAINYLKYKTSKPTANIPIKRYTPQIISLMVINACNLRCNYCGLVRDGYFDSGLPKKEMTLEVVKRIFSSPLAKNGVLVDLLGGEPLLNSEFVDIVGYLHGNGHLTNTSTNGLLLPKYITELKNNGITRINVSVYPTNLNFLKKELAGVNKIFPTHSSYVLTKPELEDGGRQIIEMIKFLKGNGCKTLRFWMFRPLGNNPDMSNLITSEMVSYKKFKDKILEQYNNFVLWPAEVASDDKIGGGGAIIQSKS